MLKRVITALVALPLFLFFVLKGGIYTFIFALFVSIVGMYEFYEAVKNYGKRPINWVGYLMTILFFVGLYFKLDFHFYFGILFLSCLILLVLNMISIKDKLVDIGITITGSIYIGLGFAHLLLLERFDNEWIIFIPFLISWGTDTFAYFTGKFLGRKKLFERVSPKKTIEGAIGGIIGSVIINYIFAYFLIKDILPVIIIISLFGSILSQTGDLIASRIKRTAGIKDFGKLLPGHGGILDRFDSSLVTIPIVYYFIYIFKLFI